MILVFFVYIIKVRLRFILDSSKAINIKAFNQLAFSGKKKTHAEAFFWGRCSVVSRLVTTAALSCALFSFSKLTWTRFVAVSTNCSSVGIFALPEVSMSRRGRAPTPLLSIRSMIISNVCFAAAMSSKIVKQLIKESSRSTHLVFAKGFYRCDTRFVYNTSVGILEA